MEPTKKDIIDPPKNAMALWEGEKETGFESTDSGDYQIPFIYLLQKGSKQVDEDNGEHIPGAKPGLFLDTSTCELLETITVIPCHYKRAMVEWKPRESGGGFVAHHPVGYEQGLQKNEKGKFVNEVGNIIEDTRYYFCLRMLKDGEAIPCVISFSASQIKKSKNWMSKMKALKATGKDGNKFTPPMWSHTWKMSSVAENNDQYTWKGYKIELEGPVVDSGLFQKAAEAREMFKASESNLNPSVIENVEDKEDIAL